MNFSATTLSWTSIHDFLALPLCQDKEVAYSQLSKLSIYNEKFLYQTSCSSKSVDVAYDQYPSLCLWQQEISRTELTILLKLILNFTSYCNRVKRPIILPAWTSRKKFIYPTSHSGPRHERSQRSHLHDSDFNFLLSAIRLCCGL